MLETYSTDSIVSPHGFKTILDNSMDIGLVKMNNNGTRIWGSYLGGNYIEIGNSIAILPNSQLLIAGGTNSGNNIGTANTHQPTLSGDYDGFLIKINDCEPPTLVGSIMGRDTLCSHTTSTYSVAPAPDAIRYHWILPNNWQGQSDSNTITVVNDNNSGTIRVYAESNCGGISDTLYIDILVPPTPTVAIQYQNNILSSTTAYSNYQWLHNGVPIPGATTRNYIPTENGTYSLLVIDDNGCENLSNAIDISTMGILAYNTTPIFCYPNPTYGTLYLHIPYQGTITMYDILGRKLKTWQVDKHTATLNISDYPTGTYTLQYSYGHVHNNITISKL